MNVRELVSLVNKAFEGIPNNKTLSLIEAYYLDSRASLNCDLVEAASNRANFRLFKRRGFIESNYLNGRFVEPFNTYTEIPAWYIKEFSFDVLFLLDQDKFNFYLPAFITQFLLLVFSSTYIDYPTSIESWFDYLLPDYLIDNESNLVDKIHNLNFNSLSDERKSAAALFLNYYPTFDGTEQAAQGVHKSLFFMHYWREYLR